MTGPLVASEELYHHLIELNDPRWIAVDCRFELTDPDAGERAYRQGHIPGARYAHLDRDLAGPTAAGSGRHPLPDPTVLAATLGGWGIRRDSRVVAYDAAGGAIAARLWWLLRWLGAADAAVLDGGLPAWQQAGFPLTADAPTVAPATFEATPAPDAWVDLALVERNLRQRDRLVIDARAGERFRGETEPLDPVAGHIPGAVNLPLFGNLDGGRFRSPEALRSRFLPVLERAGVEPSQVVHSCGSGVTACHNALAMEIAGLGGSRVYAGSWSEWCQDERRPVATGAD